MPVWAVHDPYLRVMGQAGEVQFVDNDHLSWTNEASGEATAIMTSSFLSPAKSATGGKHIGVNLTANDANGDTAEKKSRIVCVFCGYKMK